MKINVYGPDGQILESNDLSEQPVYNDVNCAHERTAQVEDESIPGTHAVQCQNCMTGWLIKDKINEVEIK